MNRPGRLIGVTLIGIALLLLFRALRTPSSPLTLALPISLVVIGYLVASIKIIEQGDEALVQRLGRYKRTLAPGLNFILPLIDTVLIETLREQILYIEPLLVITKDSIPLEIGVTVNWSILDLRKTYYSVEDPQESLTNSISAKLRTEVGQMDLEKVFASRREINLYLLRQADRFTANWGIKIVNVEIQDILLAKAVLGEQADTVEFTFHDGIDWTAFKYSFNLVIETEDIELNVQSIEDKGNGTLVIRVKVPSEANKARFYKDFMQNYEVVFQALEDKYQKELQAKEEQITLYRQQSADMKEIMSLLAGRPINIKNENQLMNNSSDQSRSNNINVGRDFNIKESVFNLGEIVGNVTNAINRLPDTKDSEPGIKELLQQLKTEIESSTELSTEDKADALEQVGILAEIGEKSEQPEREKIGRKAIKLLKGTLAQLPATATIVEACSKLLPFISKALGLPL